MAEVPGTSSETITETVQTSTPPPPQQVNDGQLFVRQVDWQPVTVSIKDTAERASACCCIYEKPRQFGESSSESEGDDDDEGCGSAHCILGHGRRGHGQTGGGGTTVPPNSGGSHSH
ncbi:E3 ubiquitin-protein ligase PPP1R11 [Neolamprologus brichardi]|uniref:E3 ubiquitin-protein ligase PPP1R11 n=1 Tax=Neolamprologus brichardi TaxID=32507 RepID=UPI001643F0B4|nr:E3 ubiquitin-protein ligase PPP1R11 [Neolamprologus brichardi]